MLAQEVGLTGGSGFHQNSYWQWFPWSNNLNWEHLPLSFPIVLFIWILASWFKQWCFVEDFGFCTEFSTIWNGRSFWIWSPVLIKCFCVLGWFSFVLSWTWSGTAKNQKPRKLGLYSFCLCLCPAMLALLQCWKNSVSH